DPLVKWGPLGFAFGDESAAPPLALDQPVFGERRQSLPNRDSTDPVEANQLCLRGQPSSGGKRARHNLFAQDVLQLVVERNFLGDKFRTGLSHNLIKGGF